MEMVAATAAAIGAAGTLAYGGYRGVRAGIAFTRRAWEFGRRTTSIYALIEKELQPNGGSSLRDTVSRIEMRQMTSDRRHRAFLSAAVTAHFETNERGEYIWVNPAFKRLIDRDWESIRGNGWVNSISQSYRDDVCDEWQRAIAQRRDFTMDYVIKRGNEQLHVHSHAIAMLKENGELLGYVGTLNGALVDHAIQQHDG